MTDSGREIAQMLYEGISQEDTQRLKKAVERLLEVKAHENIGGDYTAMEWLANAWMHVKEVGLSEARPKAVMDRAYFDYFISNDAEHFKEYLQRKYGVGHLEIDDPEKHRARLVFLEDMVMFNNPARTEWEPTDRVVEIVASLDPSVRSVIDLGAGFGYFAQRFAQALGKDAVVYAVDTNQSYVDALAKLIKDYGVQGVRPVVSTPEDINVTEPTDLVFISSLYHVLYAWSQGSQRDAFMNTLDQTLRSGGYLVILDNLEHDGKSLHSSVLNKDFAIAQLYHYGFELVKSEELSPYRYILVMRKVSPAAPKAPAFDIEPGSASIRVSSSDSVIHIGSLDSFDITPAGIDAGKLLLKALIEGDTESARAAIKRYQDIIPNENFGGEYTALQWIARYIAGSEEEQRAMIKEPSAAEFLAYVAADDYADLKKYVAQKYKLPLPGLTIPRMTVKEAMDEKNREIGVTRRQELEDFILFNNPMRESWEKSSRIMERVPLRPGNKVVDVGSGPGYFTFKLAERVGPTGLVYAMDTKDSHIKYLSDVAEKWGLTNIRASVSSAEGFEIADPGSADMVFMCSLYHIIYGVSSQKERDGMIASIRKALKPGGRFVVVDNGPVERGKLPYHGPYIRQELIRAQLEAYGFMLESAEQIIPQRYMMVFVRSS